MSNARETNVEFVTRIMEFAPTGAMAQMFVIEAMGRYAKEISKADLSAWSENSIIHPAAWKHTADFILEELEQKYGTRS